MSATISAVEWRIRRRLTQYAEHERWPVSPQLLGRIAKLAAQAAGEGRPVDSPPRRAASGRKAARKAPGRPSAARTPVRGSTETSESATGASEALRANRGAR